MATRKPLVPVYKSAEKTATNGTIVDSLSSNSTKDAPSINAVKKNKTAVKVDNVIQEDLSLSTSRTAKPTNVAKVQLKDADGKVIWVETSADQVFLKSTDGTSEISQSQLNDKIGELINLVAFYNSSPVSALTELKKYIATIE